MGPSSLFPFKIYIYLYIYYWQGWVFLATQAFSSCGELGYSLVAMHQLLIAVASLVAEHGFQACGLQ